MAFKIKPFYKINNVPIYNVDMEEGVLGKANNNGTIIVNKNIKDLNQLKDVINHEMVHIKQMKRGDLDYDEKNVYWKGKTIKRSSIKEGSPSLAWEKEAYNKTK
tara:strand:+ start:6613 stop:6924 length:312 start_codon:yes stop_codon:yes gene_type:complete